MEPIAFEVLAAPPQSDLLDNCHSRPPATKKHGQTELVRKYFWLSWLLGVSLLAIILLLNRWHAPAPSPPSASLAALAGRPNTPQALTKLTPAWKLDKHPTPGNQASATRAPDPRVKKIEDIRVGDRVAATGRVAEDDNDEMAAEIDPATWRRLELRAAKVDGSFADVELLRPTSWITQEQACVGGSVQFDAPECGISGKAKVLAICQCPLIKPGRGCVVTGTFKHNVTKLLEIYLEGQDKPLGVTSNHLCWSEDRQQFVRADQLRIEEKLRGNWSDPRILRVVPRQIAGAVYNLEVQGSHVYHVTPAGLLVHNANPTKGYIYEITYTKGGMTKVYVGSNVGDVYERLWGVKTSQSRHAVGREILKANPKAKVRIWEVDMTGTSRRGLLNTHEQHVKEEAIRRYGKKALENAIEARSKDPGSAYKDSKKRLLPEPQQRQIQKEIRRLQADGKKLPRGTPANRPIEQMSKYDLDTLRYGDMRGKPVVEGAQSRAKELARLLCGR